MYLTDSLFLSMQNPQVPEAPVVRKNELTMKVRREITCEPMPDSMMCRLHEDFFLVKGIDPNTDTLIRKLHLLSEEEWKEVLDFAKANGLTFSRGSAQFVREHGGWYHARDDKGTFIRLDASRVRWRLETSRLNAEGKSESCWIQPANPTPSMLATSERLAA